MPVISGGYVVVDPAYRGAGIQSAVNLVYDELALEIGYPAIVSRIAMTSRAAIPALRDRNQYTGVIPRSLKVRISQVPSGCGGGGGGS